MGKKACIIGSGNWGSAIARIVGTTVKNMPDVFDPEVPMWVFEEEVNGRKLSEIINTDHENVKYLPGRKLPANVKAVPDLVQAVKDADILIFVVPHQFVDKICAQIKGKLKSGAFGVSLIKGVADCAGGIKLISLVIKETLGINIAALMGANLANEIADENFSEATIGSTDVDQGVLLKKLFQVDYFRITCVQDAATVELCGALKNIVACGAGFSDGLGYGDNTKAAIIRLGLMEMTKFIEIFYPGSNLATFFESCGVADLITTCYGGRNRKCSEEFVRSGKPIEQIEKEMLNGQKLQGPDTAAQVYKMLHNKQMENKFPLFTAIHHICIGQIKPTELTNCLKHHPEHM